MVLDKSAVRAKVEQAAVLDGSAVQAKVEQTVVLNGSAVLAAGVLLESARHRHRHRLLSTLH